MAVNGKISVFLILWKDFWTFGMHIVDTVNLSMSSMVQISRSVLHKMVQMVFIHTCHKPKSSTVASPNATSIDSPAHFIHQNITR